MNLGCVVVSMFSIGCNVSDALRGIFSRMISLSFGCSTSILVLGDAHWKCCGACNMNASMERLVRRHKFEHPLLNVLGAECKPHFVFFLNPLFFKYDFSSGV